MNITENDTGHISAQCPPSIGWLCFNDSDKPICTFLPLVEAIIELRNPNKTIIKKMLRLRLQFQNCQSEVFEVPISQINQFDWEAFDTRCILSSPKRKSKEEIGNLIRASCIHAETSVRYVAEKLGIDHIDNCVYFATGNQIIFPTTKKHTYPLDPPNLPFRLDIDCSLSTEEIFKGMQALICLSSEIGRVLVSHVISGITRNAFQKVGVNPCAVLVIVGESGMLKSSYVPHMVQLYNRLDEIAPTTRFNSTTRFIEEVLYEHCACTAIIDDLHTAESRSIKRRNETTVEEMIRRIGDDTGRGRMDGNTLVQKSFRGNAIFIGEYMTGRESTIPRALVVNLTQRPDGRILDKYQRHYPLLVSTFYYHFIQWYVDYYEDICNDIDARFTSFREYGTIEGIHARLQDTYFYLQISYMLFLSFCKNSGSISQDDLLDEYNSFSQQLLTLIKTQQSRFRPNEVSSKDINWLKVIRKLYKHGQFHLADDVTQFDKARHDGLIYDRCLCLRKDGLSKVLHKTFPFIELNDVIRFLMNKNVLKHTCEKRTIQIGPLHGTRFYAIYLESLGNN